VLRLEKAGVNDNFFDLGGHSLLATQLVSRIKTNFETRIPLSRFFELPTIAQLGNEIQHSRQKDFTPNRPCPASILLSDIDKLSPLEIDALLQKELG
jgi:acyl carrier protein